MTNQTELHLAIDLSEKGKYKDAIKVLNKLLKKDPRHQQARFERAYALKSINDDVQALEDLKELLRINADYPGAKDWFARIAAENGSALAAAEMKYQDLKTSPNGEMGMGISPQAWSDCATYYLNANQGDKGIGILMEYFEKFAGNVTQYACYETAPMRTLSCLYLQSNDFEKAFLWADKAMNSKYKVPADYEQYIWTLYYLKKLDLARQEYHNYINAIHGGSDSFVHIQKLKKALFG